MRIRVGSASPATCLTTDPDSCMARDPFRAHPTRNQSRRERSPAPVTRRGDLVLIDHQPDSDAALLVIGHVPIRDGAEPHGQDPRDLHTLFDEETPYGFNATLAELIVVIARALGIRAASERDRGARVGLQLLDEPEQRRLGAVTQLGLVEAEVDIHAIGDLALVAIAPQPREPAVDAIRLGERAVGLGERGIRAAPHVAQAAFQCLHLHALLIHPARYLVHPLPDLDFLLAQKVPHPVPCGASRREDGHGQHEYREAGNLPHTHLLEVLKPGSKRNREILQHPSHELPDLPAGEFVLPRWNCRAHDPRNRHFLVILTRGPCKPYTVEKLPSQPRPWARTQPCGLAGSLMPRRGERRSRAGPGRDTPGGSAAPRSCRVCLPGSDRGWTPSTACVRP